jgi:hypothetical protein
MINIELKEIRDTPIIYARFHPETERFSKLGRATLAFVESIQENFDKLSGNMIISYEEVEAKEVIEEVSKPIEKEEIVEIPAEEKKPEIPVTGVRSVFSSSEEEIKTGNTLFSERVEEAKKAEKEQEEQKSKPKVKRRKKVESSLSSL